MIMSTQVSNPVINTYTPKCSRVINGNICGFPNVKTGRYSWQNPRCKDCVSLCGFVDVNGNTCQEKVGYNNFCNLHSTIVYQLREYEGWKAAVEFHKKYVYCGKHWEKADEDGPIDIYHYMSRDRLGSKTIDDIDELDEWDYDQEIWLGDKLWPFCGPWGEEKIKNEYPDNFEEQLQLKALVKVKSD